MSNPKDILGRDLDESEVQLLDVYNQLKTLAGRPDLPPCVERNAKQALAHLANAARDLNLVYESLLESHQV